MSEFKWVPEVGMKVKVGSVNDPDYIGVLLPEHSDPEHPKSEVVILSERRKKILSWLLPCVQLNPVGKKSEKHYAKAKKEWEDAQVIGVGDWVERVAEDNHFVRIGDISKCLSNNNGCIRIDNEYPAQEHFTEYFRKLTPAEVESHEASLKPEFKVGDYVYHKNDREDLSMWEIEWINDRCLSCGLKGVDIEFATCTRLLERLRPATAEEIKAATRTVHDLDRGDMCFFLCVDGEVSEVVWDHCDYQKKWRARGHIHLTRESAEAEDARRVAANARAGGGV